jgi:sialate O-acetylesterase
MNSIKMSSKKYLMVLLWTMILVPFSIWAEISLPHIFSSHMVLQRNANVKLFGWADPNEAFSISTSWDGKKYAVKTGNDAKWLLEITTPGAGGPYIIRLGGENNTIELKDVLLGEVWLCSGQSNMEWSANSGIDNAKQEIANANNPNIRLFTVAKRTATTEQEDVHGQWNVCTPEHMADFSAVAYFFAKRLQDEMNIPIGLIDSSWGASAAEVWTPEHVFQEYPELVEHHKKIKENPWVTTERSALYNAMIAPLRKFSISGVLWYQGESNTANAETYGQLFTEIISSWRNGWQKDFPFYFVQIAPYKYDEPRVGAIVRNQQRRSLVLENTAMVVTSDIGNVNDIHPKNKQGVGRRLANIALKEHYGLFSKEVHGPLFKKMVVDGKEVALYFDHAEGLHFTGKQKTDFEVAGDDGIFYPAMAKVKENIIWLQSKMVDAPKKVRFAWANTATPNLFNGVDLPTSTFLSH